MNGIGQHKPKASLYTMEDMVRLVRLSPHVATNIEGFKMRVKDFFFQQWIQLDVLPWH